MPAHYSPRLHTENSRHVPNSVTEKPSGAFTRKRNDEDKKPAWETSIVQICRQAEAFDPDHRVSTFPQTVPKTRPGPLRSQRSQRPRWKGGRFLQAANWVRFLVEASRSPPGSEGDFR